MVYTGHVSREGDHLILVGTCDDGRQVGGERVDRVMHRALQEAAKEGFEVFISIQRAPVVQATRFSPGVRPEVTGPIASDP